MVEKFCLMSGQFSKGNLEHIDKLRRAVIKGSFEIKGDFYFRDFFDNHTGKRLFEKSGLIERVGTSRGAEERGVYIPQEKRSRGGPVHYKLKNQN